MIGAVLIAAMIVTLLGYIAHTVHQGTLAWQRTYESCLAEGNSPVECKVRVSS